MCKYCDTNDNEQLFLMYGGNTNINYQIWIDKENKLIIRVRDNHFKDLFEKAYKWKFCPACGRNLATDNEVDDGK